MSSTVADTYRTNPWSVNPGNASFYAVVTVLLILTLVVCLYVYIQRWNSSPVKERGRSRHYIIMFVVSFDAIAIQWGLLNMISWKGMNCAVVTTPMTIFVPLFATALGLRLIDFYYDNQLVKEKIHFASLNDLNKAFDGHSCKGIRHCHKRKRALHVILFAVVVYILLVFLITFSALDYWTVDFEEMGTLSAKCALAQRICQLAANVGVAFGFGCLGVYVLHQVKHAKENFLMKQEIVVLFGGMFYIVCFLISGAFQHVVHDFYESNVDYASFPFLFVPAFIFTLYSLGYMSYKTFSIEYRSSVDSTTKDSSAGTSVQLTTVRKVQSLEELCTEFQAVLSDPEGSTLFEKFLEREWSVENIVFWKAAARFRADFEKLPDKIIVAKQIYGEYIIETAPLCVNIAYPVRQKIKNVMIPFASADPSDAEKEKVDSVLFQAAEEEIFNLMLKDSYRRFVFKEDSGFQQLRSRLFGVRKSLI
jgi:hypothetical protein